LPGAGGNQIIPLSSPGRPPYCRNSPTIITDREKAAFEAGIKLGTLSHRLFGLPLAQNTQAYDLVFSASTVLGFYLECVLVAAVLYHPTPSGHPSPKTPGGERITETIEMWLLSVLPAVAPFRIAP
jgi:hypothetical protein